jgi:hypothetical protein
MLPRFVAKTATEKEMLFYEFNWNGRQNIYFTNCVEKDYGTECEILIARSEAQPLKAN